MVSDSEFANKLYVFRRVLISLLKIILIKAGFQNFFDFWGEAEEEIAL